MMVMTAKVDKKKIAIIFAAVVVAIAALVILLGGGRKSSPTATTNVSNNDARVEFLKNFGWDVTTSPAESSQVRIPEKSSEVFDRYNEMQKQQGYDLTQYAGKTVMRYVYKVNNYPGAIEPVYATLLVHKNQVIGGDITNTAAKGHIHGFKKPDQAALPSAPTTAATTPTATDPTAVTE